MKFLCLGYYNEKVFNAAAKADIEAVTSKCKGHDEALHQSGHLLMVASLGPTRETKSLRPKNGRPVAMDGPFAETKEQIGSFFIIEAKDLEEAAVIAAKHPAANLGENLGWGIEVRPIGFYFER